MRIFFLACAIATSFVAYGQDSLKTVKLEEVAITATRSSAFAPITQKTIERKAIEALDIGQNPVVALEKLTPSVISYSDAGTGFGNYNQIRLRGMDQSRINITLNGVPLNDMVDQGTFFSNFADLSSSIQSVQVQRGVGITSNGTASYAGSINYESINLGDPEASGSIGATVGSFGTLKVNAEGFTGRMENDFSAYARVSRITSDGYKYHSGTNAQSLFFSGGKFYDKSVLKFTGFAGKTQNDQAYLPILEADIKADPRTNYFSRNDTDDFEQEMAQLQYIFNLNEAISINTSAYYGGSRGYFPFTFGNQFLYTVINNHYGLFGNVSFKNEFVSLDAGIHAYIFDRVNEEAIAPGISEPYYDDRTDKNEISAFIKTEYHLADNITAFAELQFRSIQTTFSSDSLEFYTGNFNAERDEVFVNPKIGFSILMSAFSNVYASFGRTGREPTRSDLLVDPTTFSYIGINNFEAFTDNNLFKSEYVNDIEIGYRLNRDDLAVQVNGFLMSFENEIAAVGGLAGTSYFPIRRNVASSTRSGMEVDASYVLDDAFSFGLIATYMITNIDEYSDGGETFTNIEHAFAPTFMINPSIAWEPFPTLSLGIDGRYVSKAYLELSNNPELILPSYFVANGNVKYGITKNIDLGIWINNVFNERYYTDGAPLDQDFDGVIEGPGYRIQPPRHFFLSLDVNF